MIRDESLLIAKGRRAALRRQLKSIAIRIRKSGASLHQNSGVEPSDIYVELCHFCNSVVRFRADTKPCAVACPQCGTTWLWPPSVDRLFGCINGTGKYSDSIAADPVAESPPTEAGGEKNTPYELGETKQGPKSIDDALIQSKQEPSASDQTKGLLPQVIVSKPKQSQTLIPTMQRHQSTSMDSMASYLVLTGIVFAILVTFSAAIKRPASRPKYSIPYAVNPPDVQFKKPPPTVDVSVRGHQRKDGTYVKPHYRSHQNGLPQDNFSAKGNVNPYTGKRGSK